MFPYLDLSTFRQRTMMPVAEVDYVESENPGFTATRIALRSSYINGRLRKRYGNDGARSSLPFGQTAPLLVAAGTTPPNVTLQGRPTLGAYLFAIEITTGGAFGVALFKWTSDGGITWTSGVSVGPLATLGATGVVALFADATYSVDNVYMAASPVPEIVLEWLTAMVTYDVYQKRGINPQDPQAIAREKDSDDAKAELKEAADSKDGLFDLPSSEDEDSAVTTGGPLGYSETSPYVWTDVEANVGRAQDAAYRRMTGGGQNDG